MAISKPCQIEAVRSLGARQIQIIRLSVPQGTTVQAVLNQLTWPVSGAVVGVWGRKVPLAHLLQCGDRLEVYRSLQVDPKEARRKRYAQHVQTVRYLGKKVPASDA